LWAYSFVFYYLFERGFPWLFEDPYGCPRHFFLIFSTMSSSLSSPTRASRHPPPPTPLRAPRRPPPPRLGARRRPPPPCHRLPPPKPPAPLAALSTSPALPLGCSHRSPTPTSFGGAIPTSSLRLCPSTGRRSSPAALRLPPPPPPSHRLSRRALLLFDDCTCAPLSYTPRHASTIH
jgi:hypothetical protein